MVDPSPTRVQMTQLLGDLLRGDGQAAERVMPLLYAELRALAGLVAQDVQSVRDVQPTELIHEAYVRLVDVDGQAREVESRLHFKRLAARAMHGILIDRARANRAAKRGGNRRPNTLNEGVIASARDDETVVEVHDGLEVLRGMDPRLADIVEMRFFGGMSVAEVAGVLGVSESTVARDWRLARAWWIEEFAGDSTP